MSTANEMLYPMHVMSVKYLLKMEKGDHLHHQALVEKGVVVKWNPMMYVGPCSTRTRSESEIGALLCARYTVP